MSNPLCSSCSGAAFDQVGDVLSVGAFPAGEHGVGEIAFGICARIGCRVRRPVGTARDAAAQRPVDCGLDPFLRSGDSRHG